ncbi:RagB/SusD family nutrient uptake outer membrane protein [Flavobacterium olei]|uniref:RagB/SusD family nutrient uptake outer membrane protein n=1 Tax=Flavobacterium olei TaxID=1886782 RepID=UPI00321A7C8A
MKYFKNIKTLKFSVVLALLCLLQSCSDFLEQEPGTQTSINEQLADKKGVLTALNGVYYDLRSIHTSPTFAVYSDLQGGNLKFSPTYSDDVNRNGIITVPTILEGFYSFNDQSLDSDLSDFYGNGYKVINEANLIIEFVDGLKDATEAEKKQIKAEALTARAYMHFLLSEFYSQNYSYTSDASHLGIVYSTKSITNGLQYASRETVSNTYTHIVEDLTTAISLYSDNVLLSGPAYGYFNKNNTKALLSRVYLSKNDWQKAYDTANDVISNSGVNLVDSANYIAQWEQPDLPVSEILMEFTVSKNEEGTTSSSLAALFGYTDTKNFQKYVASQDLIALYEASDIRRQLFLVQPLTTLVNLQPVKLNYYFTKKFQGNPGYVVSRLSEQYLIRAEAALKLNNTDQAKKDINTIRSRANATALKDSENLQDALFLERRKELCFEGHLFFDIVRNHKDVSRNDGCLSAACSLTYPSPKFVLPIPKSNLNLNHNLKQNESY